MRLYFLLIFYSIILLIIILVFKTKKMYRLIRRKKRLILFSIIMLFFINLYLIKQNNPYLNYEYLKINIKKAIYIVNDYFEENWKSRELILPDNIEFSKNENNQQTNFKCLMPLLNYNEKLSIDFLKSDFATLKSTFDSCLQSDAKIDIDKVLEVIRYQNETYSFRINHELIKSSFDFIQNLSNLKCLTQRFDKKLNESEEFEEVEYFDHKIQFDPDRNFQIDLKDQYGYYYFYCSYEKKFLFDYVYNLMPSNMSKLIDKRIMFKNHIDRFVKNLNIDSFEQVKMFQNEFINDDCYSKKDDEKMNVLILGIDSISFNHFRRVLPLTFEYLEKTGIIYDHFNSLGTNTYPNIVAMMSGIVDYDINEYNVSGEIQYYRKFDQTSYHDHLPFIWNEYEKLGYVTHYQEDKPPIAIFNYLKNGFRYWPTSLYGRGFWVKYYQIRNGPDKCHYKKPTYVTWFNQIKSFVENMNSSKNKKPFFSFNFLTEYTHSHLALPPDMDRELRDLISSLDSKGYFDNTMFILFTDHGNRLKFYAYATEIGKLERYSPFFSIRLPKKFQSTRYYRNALKNKNKLFSFHDVHQTLRQFLYLNKYGAQNDEEKCNEKFRINIPNDRNYRGISLFEEIPMNRSCKDALIPNVCCNCFSRKNLTEQELVTETGSTFDQVAKMILVKLNDITKNERNKCMEFKLEKIASIKKMIVNNIVVYTCVLVAQPGDAWFETNLKLSSHNLKKKILNIHGLPSRLSAYGNQSHCVNDPILVNYCFCHS